MTMCSAGQPVEHSKQTMYLKKQIAGDHGLGEVHSVVNITHSDLKDILMHEGVINVANTLTFKEP